MEQFMPILMVITIFAGLIIGFPVAFTLGGVALIYAVAGELLGIFNLASMNALPSSVYGVMTSDLLIAVPLFVFMGITLERAKIAEELLETMTGLFGSMRAGLGISVLLVGAMLAASTGIVGATVVTMGLFSLPAMIKNGYCKKISTGTICAAGTLGQIIPPSIVLILLADQISSSWQTAQLNMGVLTPIPVSVSDLFVAALIPGLGLVGIYIVWQLIYSAADSSRMPPLPAADREDMFKDGKLKKILYTLMPPLLLIGIVLGSILGGIATATESAAVGALGAMGLSAWKKQLSRENMKTTMEGTLDMSAMVFMILIGAAIFTLVFRGYNGDALVQNMISDLPGGLFGAMIVTMLIMFFLGFFLDFIQIIFVMVPIVAPSLLAMGADPIWLAVMMAINLQTSFLTPPFGFSLFYLRGVAPKSVLTTDIYKGVIPFVVIQIMVLIAIASMPVIATWMPKVIYGTDFSVVFEEAAKNTGAIKGATIRIGEGVNSWDVDY